MSKDILENIDVAQEALKTALDNLAPDCEIEALLKERDDAAEALTALTYVEPYDGTEYLAAYYE